MSDQESVETISSVGEKKFIRDFIRPLFNRENDWGGVGDDCGILELGDDFLLLSTDRVPSDLTGFRLGILDHRGLGDYLARLNLSDIAACGGKAVGLLLNLGLPSETPLGAVKRICEGFDACVSRHGARVLGGDITDAAELSISATSIGIARRGQVLLRGTATPGDSIFISRPIGLTPAAFLVFLGEINGSVPPEMLSILRRQFTEMEPMLSLGQALGQSGQCTSCMDNTDGIGQTLSELAEASNVAFIVERPALSIPDEVLLVCDLANRHPLDLVFNGGADFSLVGTVRGEWSSESVSTRFGHPMEIIGCVETGSGVWLRNAHIEPLQFQGWNYFSAR